jgi:hypothetical protein
VSPAPVPSVSQIIALYNAGVLSTELARYHGTVDGKIDAFVKRCVALHNNGDIDLVAVPSQPAFSNIVGHSFFTAQQFFCDAIPQLQTHAGALMECCRLLIEQAGTDGAATLPNRSLQMWCQENPAETAVIIQQARAGDALAQRFVATALRATNDIQLATDFVRAYEDGRRLSGMTTKPESIWTPLLSIIGTIRARKVPMTGSSALITDVSNGTVVSSMTSKVLTCLCVGVLGIHRG